MDSTKTENLVTECRQIQDDSTYTAEAHHIMGCALSKRAFWMKLTPVLITVASAFILLMGWSGGGDKPNWAAWVTMVSGIVATMNVIMEPEKAARSHLFAAKAFTVLKHDARATHESFRHFMSESEFFNNVKLLRERYNLLVQSSPATDEQAFEKARLRVKSDVHEADFRLPAP